MNSNIRNKAILKAAWAAVFAVMFCVGCYDLGIEPSVKSPTIETFVDIRDGKEYKKVKIGEQVWMGENLNYAADGSECYYQSWSKRTAEQNCEEYGRLYDWNTAMNGETSSNANPSGVEGVCPGGWHLPSNAEWEKLVNYVGEHSGTKLKSKTFPSGGSGPTRTPEGTDLYNFSALPGGYGSYMYAGQRTDEIHCVGLSDNYSQGRWWTSTEQPGDSDVIYHTLMANDRWEVIQKMTSDKHTYFFSVRCVHD
jgi:uncharacterized protein (TIGR02145 family)